jgi:hypothetical protein
LTELLIVEEESVIIKLPVPEINTHENLRSALSQEQITLIDGIIAGETADELAIDIINELALEIIGDNLIEDNLLIEEYILPWKEGTL